MAVPLLHGNDAIGVLLADSKSTDAFAEEDLRLLSLFAALLAPALQAAQHHANSEARRAEAEGLATLMRLAASAANVDEVLDAVVSTASSLTGADYTRIALNEQGYLGPASVSGAHTTNPLGQVLHSRQSDRALFEEPRNRRCRATRREPGVPS